MTKNTGARRGGRALHVPTSKPPGRLGAADVTTDRPILRVLDRLDRVAGRGPQWSARCPAHDDRTPSLGVAETADGVVLLTCHAGCSRESVVAAVGLSMADLFPVGPDRDHIPRPRRRGSRRAPRPPRGPRPRRAREATADERAELERNLARAVAEIRRDGLPVTLRNRGATAEHWADLGIGRRGSDAIIGMRDRDGVLRQAKIRHAGGPARYTYLLAGVETPPWVSPDDEWRGDAVDIVEGELDAAVMYLADRERWTIGLGGTSREIPWELLDGRRIRIRMDAGEAGDRAAHRIATEARRRGILAEIIGATPEVAA